MQLLIKINLLLLMFLCFNVQAQECSTPDIQPEEAQNFPWFGNPDYLPAFMDSVRAVDGIPSQYSRIIPNIKWRIPVRFWIFTQGF